MNARDGDLSPVRRASGIMIWLFICLERTSQSARVCGTQHNEEPMRGTTAASDLAFQD